MEGLTNRTKMNLFELEYQIFNKNEFKFKLLMECLVIKEKNVLTQANDTLTNCKRKYTKAKPEKIIFRETLKYVARLSQL